MRSIGFFCKVVADIIYNEMCRASGFGECNLCCFRWDWAWYLLILVLPIPNPVLMVGRTGLCDTRSTGVTRTTL